MAFVLATTSSNKLDERFAQLRSARRKALVCYATAGHPDRARSIEVLRALEDGGADVIELGIPFSDPLADGPVIQASSQVALAGGMTPAGAIELVSDAALEVPVVLFSYLNPLLAAGPSLLERARAAGCAGVLVTDLPVGADAERERWLASSGLAFVRLVAPTTPAERIAEIANHGSGFVYVISRLGVTGLRATMADDIEQVVKRVRSATSLPICVGFGVSTAEHAAQIARIADGVVVGTAIVRAAEAGPDTVLQLTRDLRAAIDSATDAVA